MEEDNLLLVSDAPDSTQDCLEDKLGLWLRVAHKAFTDLVNSEFRRYRVTQLDFLVLNLIANLPGCRQNFIAQSLDIKSSNLAAAIDYLVQRGYVSKTPDPIDRRANHLTLTETGTAFVDQLAGCYAEITRMFFPGPRGEEHQRAMVTMLKQVSRCHYGPRVVGHGGFDPAFTVTVNLAVPEQHRAE